MYQAAKKAFGFETEQEIIQQYYSKIHGDSCFESKILENIIKRLGIHRNYFLEERMLQKKPKKTLQYYNLEQYLEEEFFRKRVSQGEIDSKQKRFISSLEFLNKNIKKDPSINNSDFIVSFLETFHMIFPAQLNS